MQIYTEDSTYDDQSRETARETVYLDIMDHLLVLMLLLWSSGLRTEGQHNLAESDDVRLVGGDSRCAGILELKHQGDWRPVDGADWTLQAADMYCRKLECGSAASVGLRKEPSSRSMWRISSDCVKSGSALRECTTSIYSSSILDLTCSGLRTERKHNSTESDDIRLVGGDSRCAGTLEVKLQGGWRPVGDSGLTLMAAAVFCRKLDCGSALSVRVRKESYRFVWWIGASCVQSGSALRECAQSSYYFKIQDLTCSDSVRLVNGTSLCSGRLEVRSNQSWSSVCDADFDQQDAEVVCRELGCEAPSIFQGALYGDVEAPVWTKEFQCGGNESALLDCRRSGSVRNSCSPGKAVGLTCSESDDVRLVGGDSRCAGILEVKHQGEWRPVDVFDWTLKTIAVVCRKLDCGFAVSLGLREESSLRSVWGINSDCVQSGSALRECATTQTWQSAFILDLTCSDSVRLVNGTSLCSGRLEVRSNQTWSSVCDADFDQQDAEVVCRELGCGAPSVFQGALFGDMEASKWTKEFQCGGNESALLDCRRSGSERNSCSPGKAVGLTCSESDDVRLVGGDSRCAGILEVKQGEWRPVGEFVSDWTLIEAAFMCRKLDCGSAVSIGQIEESLSRSVWKIDKDCVQSGSALRNCVLSIHSFYILNLTCSDLLLHPNISASSMDRVSKAQQQGFQVFRGSTFTISCSIQPQYPGGSFQLTFTSSTSTKNYTQPAVNHSAHFLFPAAESAHQGNYRCVYHIYVFSHDFSSESHLLSLTVADPAPFIITAVILPLTLLLVCTGLYFYCKASRGQKPGRQENIELDGCNVDIPSAEGGPTEEEGAQGAE